MAILIHLLEEDFFMVIVKSIGRLGNNIFQYNFAKKLCKNNEKICFIGYTCLDEIIKCPNNVKFYFNSNNWIAKHFVHYLVNPFFRFIYLLRIITLYTDSNKNKSISSKYTCKKGFFSSISYVYGYFQFLDENRLYDYKNLTLQDDYLLQAKTIISSIKSKNIYFVHVRRGDYISTDKSQSLSLPDIYYFNLINKVQLEKNDCFFIFLSDEPDYVSSKYTNIKNKIVSSSVVGVDLALMTLCDGGILSASSLSFSGAVLAKYKNNKIGSFYAPKFWMGFRDKKWYPPFIENNAFIFVGVPDDS